MRLFATVFLPGEIAEKIYEYSKPAAEYFYAKAVRPENMHITLKFFGDQKPDNCLKILENSVRNIKKFEVSVKNTGFFSYSQYAGVLWAGISGENSLLKKIALNIDISNKEYIAHITLARFKNDSVEKSILDKYLQDSFLKEREFGRFTVEKAVIAESVPDGGGARYRILKEFSLGETDG